MRRIRCPRSALEDVVAEANCIVSWMTSARVPGRQVPLGFSQESSASTRFRRFKFVRCPVFTFSTKGRGSLAPSRSASYVETHPSGSSAHARAVQLEERNASEWKGRPEWNKHLTTGTGIPSLFIRPNYTKRIVKMSGQRPGGNEVPCDAVTLLTSVLVSKSSSVNRFRASTVVPSFRSYTSLCRTSQFVSLQKRTLNSANALSSLDLNPLTCPRFFMIMSVPSRFSRDLEAGGSVTCSMVSPIPFNVLEHQGRRP